MAALVSRPPFNASCRMRGGGSRPLRRSIVGGGQEATTSGAGLRQTTLTQIDFVTRTVLQDIDDLECIETQHSVEPQDSALPRKRRRVSAEPRLEEQSNVQSRLETLPSASTRTRSAERRYSNPENFDSSHLIVSDTAVPSLALPVKQSDGADKINPKTPSRRQRTAVPSSQSPETTPLTLRTKNTDRSDRTMSPLAQALDRRITQPKTPSGSRMGGIAVELSEQNGPAQANYGKELNVLQSKSTDNQTVRSLRLQSPERTVISDKTVGMRLEASPNAPAEQTPRQHRGGQQRRTDPPLITTLSRIPSSQAPTQDPTQITASMALKRRPTNGTISSSQVVTQEPTQLLDSMAALPANYSRIARELGEEDAGRDYTALQHDDSATRVPSSQATTVEPSSDVATPVSRQPLRGSHRANVRSSTVKHELSSDKAELALETEEARDLTDSQLIPNSLLNWTVPFPPPLSSQGSLLSILDEDIENRNGEDGRHVPALENIPSPRPGTKSLNRTMDSHSPTHIKKEKVSDDELQVVKERPVKKIGARNSRRRVKNEPID